VRSHRSAAAVLAACLALTARDALTDFDWSAHMGGLHFVVGLERGREECKFTGLPPMVFYSSATDQGCPAFAGRTFKDPEVREKIAGYTPILVDFDTADAELKKKWRVECVPTVVFLDHEQKWRYAVNGDAPLDIFRKEAQIARERCAAPNKPAEEFAALADQKKKLDDAATAKDVKAQFAAIAEIRRIRLGEAVQAHARAADARLTQEGNDAVARASAVFDDKKTGSVKRNEAKKALEQIVADFGADHAVGKAAQAVLDRFSGKKPPKK
jgi:hypothetical protein